MQKSLVEIAEALAEGGIDLVVPLLEPRDQLGETGQGGEPLGVPAIALGQLGIPAGQRVGLLEVVPAGPTDQQRSRVSARAKVR